MHTRRTNPATISVPLGEVGLPSGSYTAHDLWTGLNSTVSGTLSVTLDAADASLLALTPVDA